ncbi:MAG: AAA family ATPase [Kofleriaceae bacterium]
MLVGRERELATLEAGLAQLASNRGAVYLVSGEPGIGKTRLANEVATLAAARGIRVAWGRCWEAGGAPAFWPWHEALGAIAIWIPDGGGIAANDPAQARFALFREIGLELSRVAAIEPLLVVLEDLHAADQSSVLLLEFLATQLRASPIMVLATYRDLEASLRVEIGDAVARIGRACSILALARLREAEVAAVVRESLDDADERLIGRVFEATDGNPLFVNEIVQQVRIAGPSAMGAIPLGVREIIRQRLALAPAAARRVLDAGAVLGVEFGAADIARMVPDAVTEIEAATTSGLVTRRRDRVRFAHALYREALYYDLPVAARQALHREAARALKATAAPAAEIAHHWLEGGAETIPEAIDQAIIGAREALDAFAFEDAIALLERARLAVGVDQPRLLARALIALGEARIRSGDPAGRELCVRGGDLARELGDASLLALAGLAYGSVFLIGGVDPVLVSMLEDALAQLPEESSGLRARTMARLASGRQPSAPALRARDIELALTAVELGRRVANRRELLEILQSASGALYGVADPQLRIPIARQQVQLAEELGDAPRLIAAYVRLSMDHLELADLAGYEQVATKYERLAARFGSAAGPWRVPLMRSMIALAHDDFAESERRQAQALTVEPENRRACRARAYHRICFLRAAERHHELRAAIGELRSLWMAMPYGSMLGDARVAGSLMRVGADEEVRMLLAGIPDEAYDEEINMMSLADAIWCTADPAAAQRLLPSLRRFGNRWIVYWLDVEILEMPVERSLAYLLGIVGDWEGCDRHFEAAMRAVQQFGRRSSVARMQFELGDLLVRHGRDLVRARDLLATARNGASNLGLAELVALIDRRHAGAVVSSPRRRFTIAREGEVYALTTGGATLRFKASRGMQYLAQLVERPGTEIHVLELVGSGEHADLGDAGEVVDARALKAYRERVEALRDVIESATERGDADRAERARGELDALALELSRGSGLGGKARRSESAVDRARSAVQRRIKDALDRIADQDAELGAWLRRVVRTGNHCSFQGDA